MRNDGGGNRASNSNCCRRGTSTPAAVAFATALFAAERRGRAIALIYGGMTLATVVGVPAGAYLASFAGWRAPFFGVAALAALAAIGVATALPRLASARAAGFAERLAVMRLAGRAANADVTLPWR